MPFKLPFSAKNTSTSLYFAIELSNEFVKSSIWTVENSDIKVLKVSETIEVENPKPDSILQAVDMAIATTIQDIDKEPNEVIFGLPQSWTDESGIRSTRKSLLKFICKKLELKPLGYVAIQDALVTYLQKQQGTPPSAIFVKLFKQKLIVTLVNLGKIIDQAEVSRKDDISSDLVQAISSFSKEQKLPGRIILYNGYLDFEDIKQQLLSASLEDKLKFIQTPRIDSLSSDVSIKAVSIAGGHEFIKSQKSQDNTAQASSPPEQTEKLPDNFVIGQDIDAQSQTQDDGQKPSESDEESPGSQIDSPETEEKQIPTPDPDTAQPISEFDNPENLTLSTDKKSKKSNKFNFKNIFTKFKLKKSKSSNPNPPTKQSPKSKSKNPKKLKLILIIIAVILLLSAIAGLAVWYLYQTPKAQIKIFVNPETIEEELQVSASTAIDQFDEDNLIIPVSYQEATVSGSETISATGSQQIGEKAEGKVTVYNKTSDDKTFDQDTLLIGPSNLRYLLADSVTVASKSSTREQVTFGKADVAIIAASLGEEYNLDTESDFTFKDYNSDDFSATNKDSISGGTSEEIIVVSQKDLTTAQTTLEEKLAQKAQDQLENNIDNNIITFPDFRTSNLTDYSFDAEAGDQLDSFTISGDLSMTILTASKPDFNLALIRNLTNNIPDGFIISEGDLSSSVSQSQEDEDEENFLFTVDVQAQLAPKLDISQLKNELTAKTPEAAQTYFSSNIPSYADSQIVIKPVLPDKKLPRKSENITIEIIQK